MITDGELDAIQARVLAATPGPWRARACGEIVAGRHVVATSDGGGGSVWVEWRNEEDKRFAAHARTDVPRLIAEIRRLRGEWRKLVEALREVDADIPLDLEPGEITNSLADAIFESDQYAECPAWCSVCGEQAANQTCPECGGCGEKPGYTRTPCETFAGDKKIHDCLEVSYAELVRVYRRYQHPETQREDES